MLPRSPSNASADAASEHAAVRGAVGIVDRRDFGLLEVTGRDRAKFLHAMLSNDIAGLAPGQGCAATLLDVHGKVQVLVRVLVLDEQVLVITPPDYAAKTNEALDTYLFSEKAYFRDASEDAAMLLLAGPEAPALAERLTGVLPDAPPWSHAMGSCRVNTEHADGIAVRVIRGSGETGEAEIWLVSTAADGEALWRAACTAGAKPVGRAAFESLRIEAGTPAFPDDIGPGVLLPEVPFIDLVSYSKGCYIGQEVVVRIRDRGHVNRLLRGLVIDGDAVPDAGAAVRADDGEIGKVTSAAWSYTLARPMALALVRRQHSAAGTPVSVTLSDGAAPATVSDLPIVTRHAR